MFSCSCSGGGEKRHKRRRHEKSLDRETSLWWHILVVPLCCQTVDQKTTKKKNDTVPHSTTFVLCYTVFLSCKSVCKLCKTKNLLETVLTRGTEFFFYVYQCLVIPATEGSQNYTTLTVTVSTGQLSKHFKQFLKSTLFVFCMFLYFSNNSCPFKNLPQPTTNVWTLCAALNAAIDSTHLIIEQLKADIRQY